jgi:hypothetical protein
VGQVFDLGSFLLHTIVVGWSQPSLLNHEQSGKWVLVVLCDTEVPASPSHAWLMAIASCEQQQSQQQQYQQQQYQQQQYQQQQYQQQQYQQQQSQQQ